ncbi:MAG: ATP-binding cassette domain-containing protein [Gammaproteobacteria bacterium]|nr:MAG: ATP-binding cassette domain-containing protein [Gammaproteobacteria bacterium]
MITLSHISLRRGSQLLLDDTSLHILPGRRIGVIGQNGTGKSSLFAMLRGELHADAGELSVPAQWRIAHMAQEVAASDRSAVDYVLDGDVRLREAEAAIAAAQARGDDAAQARAWADYEALHGYTARSRAEQLLHGLGFSQSQVDTPVSDFSGGWRIRLNLAQALMCPSELMLLDEPTNHLDLDAILWLEQWLKQYPGTLLLISHDRDFLDAVADEMIHLEHCKATLYRGNYSAFEVQRAARLAEQQATFEKQQRRVLEIQQFVNRFRAKASKARQAQSRLKELERMEKIAPAHIDSPFHFVFQPAQKSSNPLMDLRHVDIGYDGATILKKVDLCLRPGMRIGLLGPNGAGKSTLVKTLVGELPVIKGERIVGENVKLGYFAQHQLDALDMQASALLHIQRLSPRATEQEIRDFLGGFNFHGDKALEPIAPFSGGEKARLALAMVVWNRPNLLLMDEPTNHLDLEMRHALTIALQAYEGALLVISHDRHLLRNTVDEFVLVANGCAEPYQGGLEEYHRWLKNRDEPAVAHTLESAPAHDRRAQRQQSAALRQQLSPLRKRIEKLEQQLEKLAQQLADHEARLADAGLYEPERKQELQQLLQQQGDCQKQVDAIEREWMTAVESLEQLQAELGL